MELVWEPVAPGLPLSGLTSGGISSRYGEGLCPVGVYRALGHSAFHFLPLVALIGRGSRGHLGLQVSGTAWSPAGPA